MRPKLYQYAACPFCGKVASILAYKKADCEIVEVHPLNKKEIAFSENYRKVPIYIDADGKQINESNAIMRHIDAASNGKRVFPEDPAEAHEVQQWLDWSEELVQGLPTVIYDRLGDSIKAFDYITKTGKFSWFQSRMIKYSGALIMTMVAKKIRKRRGIDDPAAFFTSKIKEWGEGLHERAFMGGALPNAADLAVFGIIRSVGTLEASHYFGTHPAFTPWLEKMQEATGLSLSVV